MSDLPQHLPPQHLPPAHHTTYHLLAASTLTIADLLTLPAATISRQLPTLPLLTLRAFLTHLRTHLLPAPLPAAPFPPLPSPLPSLPAIPPGRIVDLPGASSAGKTQLLLAYTQLATSAGDAVAWITTESSGVPTRRLVDMGADLSLVHAVGCNDLETQLHVMAYQLPVLVRRARVRLVVLDSAAGNFRGGGEPGEGRGRELARRGGVIVGMVRRLRELAVREGLVVLCANQVADRFEGAGGERRLLDEQLRWFGGWEDGEKGPALGLVWAGLLAGRLVVKRARGGVRTVRVVWADWAPAGGEVRFVVEKGGVRELVEGEEGVVAEGLAAELDEGGLE